MLNTPWTCKLIKVKAYLFEYKQIPSVGIFDEVIFYTFLRGHLASTSVHIWSFIALNHFYLSLRYLKSKCWKMPHFGLDWTMKKTTTSEKMSQGAGAASQSLSDAVTWRYWRVRSFRIYKWRGRRWWRPHYQNYERRWHHKP